jgi:hypothetical protein
MTKLVSYFVTAVSFSSIGNACIAPTVILNDDVTLSGDQICTKSDGCYSSRTFLGGGVNEASNSGRIVTHKVTIVAVDSDDGGIKSTTYSISSADDQFQKTHQIRIKSNYVGNGMTARGISPVSGDPKDGAAIIEIGGCGGPKQFNDVLPNKSVDLDSIQSATFNKAENMIEITVRTESYCNEPKGLLKYVNSGKSASGPHLYQLNIIPTNRMICPPGQMQPVVVTVEIPESRHSGDVLEIQDMSGKSNTLEIE